MRNKIICILTTLMLFVTILPCSIHAESISKPEIINSGICGDGSTWELDSEGTLVISGTGAIDTFDKTVKKTLKSNTVNIIINEGITSIEDWMFDSFSKLTNITMPSSLETIGYGAFYGCKNLISIDIPKGVTFVDDWAFTNCSNLKTVTMTDSVTYLGECAFNSCGKLESIVLSNNLTVIKDSMFVGCEKLASIELPKNITQIGDYAFRNCTSLTSVVIPYGVTTIGDYAFDKCINLSSITVPNSVTTIGNSAVVFNDNITFFGVKGSLTQDYAAKNNCQFYYLEHLQCISKGWESAPLILQKAGFNTTGKKRVECENCGSVNELVIPVANAPILSTKAYAFNNKTKTPTVKVYNSDGTIIPSQASYAAGRKSVGKYAVNVTINNNEYSDKCTTYFTINPKGVPISKLSRYKKAFKVTWKKPSSTYRKQMSGYQIRYGRSSKMTNTATVTVKSTKATSKKIKTGKVRTYYYVQLRTYKTVKGVKYYSGWSSVKKVKTK